MPSQLAIEYRQWKLTKLLRSTFMSLFEVTRKEWLRNTFDRWLLSIHQEKDNPETKMIIDLEFPLYMKNMSTDDSVHQIIIKEIAKELSPNDLIKAKTLMQSFLNELDKLKEDFTKDEKLDIDPPISLHLRNNESESISEIQNNDGEKSPRLENGCPSKIQSFKSTGQMAFMRIGDLHTRACVRIHDLSVNYGYKCTATMLLRYESLGTGSYQWGDPIELHRHYYRHFGVRYEGFASPLNSRILGQSEAHFCSLFPDTDVVFGSLGDFMRVDFGQHPGGWSINPPFIESLIAAVADKVLAALDDRAVCSGQPGSLYFFCCLPCWSDTPGWMALKQSKHLVSHVDFEKSCYMVQNAYHEGLDPHCKLSHFVLGYLPEECSKRADINSLREVMESAYRDWIKTQADSRRGVKRRPTELSASPLVSKTMRRRFASRERPRDRFRDSSLDGCDA